MTTRPTWPAGWHIDHDGNGDETIWDADDKPVLTRWQAPAAFDLLASLAREGGDQ